MGNSGLSRAARFFSVAATIFTANMVLLILQLTAGRQLAPYIGSSLETWTAIIGTFLAGIAAGNAVGGWWADRLPPPRVFGLICFIGSLSVYSTIYVPHVGDIVAVRSMEFGLRMPLLAFILCFPPAFLLSMLTPLAIKSELGDIRKTGGVAGWMFAFGTLGCLVGNYLTGFHLLPTRTVNVVIEDAAFAVGATSILALLFAASRAGILKLPDNPSVEFDTTIAPEEFFEHSTLGRAARGDGPIPVLKLQLERAYAIVFIASFAGMSLELDAIRMMAMRFGVSLFTWTGIIGVMLAGTAVGNWLGGRLSDRAGNGDPDAGGKQLCSTLIIAAMAVAACFFAFWIALYYNVFGELTLPHVLGVFGCVLFFPAMLMLGTVSPQVIRLAVPDITRAGRTAGRVYAISTLGALAGTFATGWLMIPILGSARILFLMAGLLTLAAILSTRKWTEKRFMYPALLTFGIACGGLLAFTQGASKIVRETNYYTISVQREDESRVLTLALDLLRHSRVDPTDPTYLDYKHEEIQMEFLRAAEASSPENPSVLVIGGGGYTFPRCAKTLVPKAVIDVVEIDPGVTRTAYEELGLARDLAITTYNMDGRRFVVEKAQAGKYHLVTLDAVNDLTVPYHLLTKEFNTAVSEIMTSHGVYLLSVIDFPGDGKLWKAAFRTLKETYPHVELLIPEATLDENEQKVVLIYASKHPLQLDKLYETLRQKKIDKPFTHQVPPSQVMQLLDLEKPTILTDQYAPVDNLMAPTYLHRKRHDSKSKQPPNTPNTTSGS